MLAFAAWDDNALGQLPSAGGLGGLAGGTGIVPQTVKPGIANGYQAALSYGLSRSGDRASLSLSGDGSFEYFESRLEAQAARDVPKLRPRRDPDEAHQQRCVHLWFSGSGAYAPYYQYLPFLNSTLMHTNSPVGSDYGYAFDSQWVRSAGAGASIDDKFTKKSSISASANWTQQVLTADNRTIETEGVGMRYNHSFTRKLSFYVGYQLSQSQYPESGGAPFRYGNVDLGLGYGDGLVLNFGRYTTLSMNFGVSLAKNGDPVSVAKTGKSTQFFVTGAATLSRTLSRTWSASVGIPRGVTYALGFLEPFYTDSATAGLGGQVVERLFFSLGAGASRGRQNSFGRRVIDRLHRLREADVRPVQQPWPVRAGVLLQVPGPGFHSAVICFRSAARTAQRQCGCDHVVSVDQATEGAPNSRRSTAGQQ